MLLNEKYFLNNDAFTIESNNQTLLINEYLWFYLENNLHLIQYTGNAISSIDMEHFLNIEIPIPPINRQFEITSYILTYKTIQDQSIHNYNNYINNVLQNIDG